MKNYILLLCLFILILASRACFCSEDIMDRYMSDVSHLSQLTDENAKKENKIAIDDQVKIGVEIFETGKFDKAREIFNDVLKSDSRNVQAQYFLGIMEYEKGNTERAKVRFQIAHDCLPSSSDSLKTAIDDRKIQLEFSDRYETSVYYKDGWYLKPKRGANENRNIHLLDVDSNYRINIKPKNEKDRLFVVGSIIGSVILLSFFAAR